MILVARGRLGTAQTSMLLAVYAMAALLRRSNALNENWTHDLNYMQQNDAERNGGTAAATLTLDNGLSRFVFSHDGAATVSLISIAFSPAGGGGRGGSAIKSPFSSLWQLQLLTSQGIELCSPSNASSVAATLDGGSGGGNSSVQLSWVVMCPGPSTLEVHQSWSLPVGSASAAVSMSVRLHACPQGSPACTAHNGKVPSAPTGAAAALWAVALSIGNIEQGEVFFPSGYGETCAQGYGTAGGNSDAGAYPGAHASMQFMTAGPIARAGAGSEGDAAIYFAAHDASANYKWLVAREHDSDDGDTDADRKHATNGTLSGDATLPWATIPVKNGLGFDCASPLSPQAFPIGNGCAPGTQSMTITALVEGAGQLETLANGYTLPFEVAVAPLPTNTDTPVWFSAATLYREWALSSAAWTRKGPISERPTDFPKWFLDLNVWVNTGWQCYDRFNDTQGDPPTVLRNVHAIHERFNLSGRQGLGLHWYEWQCGFSDLCVADDGAHRFKFDTEYPDYDPPRRGSVFGEVVRELRELGVYTFPYINGRLFDNHSASYRTQDGVSRVIKQSPNPRLGALSPLDLSLCTEYYGSQELDGSPAYFFTADPGTMYWQDKYAAQVSRLVLNSSCAGVYIDQLASASPLADWTPRSEHGVGGGSWWRKGLVDLLNEAHDRSKVNGVWSPLVVESNAEYLMDQANGLLTLSAFLVPFAPAATPSPGAKVMAPAFPAIYGGYFVGFGSIYTHNDLALNPDVWASRVAASFVWGIQIGWFSLGGVDHGPDVDTRCGPMHTLDAFLDPAHDAEVNFLRLVATARGSMSRYFVHGRLGPPIVITPLPNVFMAPNQSIMPRNAGPFPTLSHAVWLAPPSNNSSSSSSNTPSRDQKASAPASLCLFLVTSTHSAVPVSAELRMTRYGFDGKRFAVALVAPDGSSSHMATVDGDVVHINRTVAGRHIEMLEIKPL